MLYEQFAEYWYCKLKIERETTIESHVHFISLLLYLSPVDKVC